MKPILFLFIIIISNFIQAQNQKVEFYRNLSIDDRQYKLELKDSINSKIADKTPCYHVFYDDKNRIKQIKYHNRGNWAVSENGFSDIQIKYSDSLEQRFFDYPAKYRNLQVFVVKQEKIKLNKQGIPIEVYNYDKEGNLVKDQWGIVSYKRLLNQNGWHNERQYFDENGKRILSKNGDYFFRYKWDRDSDYYKPETSYYDIEGKLHDGDRGYSIVESCFDRKNRHIIYSKYYNCKHNLVTNKNGYAYRVNNYYENGLLKSESYFDNHQKPCCNKNGFSKIVYEYNSYGNQTKLTCYLKNLSHNIEYSTQYDLLQRIIEETRKKNGILSDDLNGVAYIRYEYDITGNLKAKHTFNKKNISVLRTEY